jgi:hypothetical protein
MDVKAARNTAKQLIGQIMLGNDPQHERKFKMHQATTFADVVDSYVIWASQNAKKNRREHLCKKGENYEVVLIR